MEDSPLTYRDFARFAAQSTDQVYADCEVQVFRASGPGGQCVNTTDSAVRMRHIPSGITVTARDNRSQHRNRQACLEKLHLIFQRKATPPKVRKKTRIPRRVNEKRLQDKRFQAAKKHNRKNLD